MSSRRTARQWAMQAVFQMDFNRRSPDEVLAEFWSDKKRGGVGEFSERLIRGTWDHLAEIDALISKYAENWDISRMGAVDRNIIRVAMFEMLHCDDIPPVVSINEAVEIAKEFGQSGSSKFVNGLLDRARKDIDRPAREPVAKRPAGGKHEKVD